jgi:hypothetical protein
VQERWIDARAEWDAFENDQWRKEGELVREDAARRNKIRERKDPSDSTKGMDTEQ